MKVYGLILPLFLILFACGQKDEHAGHDHGSAEPARMEKMMAGQQQATVYYTCPMPEHAAVHAKEAGDCPECGMHLVPVVVTTVEQAEFYGCPMESHSHVRADGPGDCPECGMHLKPMRLEKS